MTTSEIIKKVASEHQCVLARPRKEPTVKGQPIQYDVKEVFTGKKKGWFFFDAFTASHMLAVYNGLRPEIQAKFDRIALPTLVNIAFKG